MRRKIEVRGLKKAADRRVFLSKNVFSKFYNTNDMTVAEAKAMVILGTSRLSNKTLE